MQNVKNTILDRLLSVVAPHLCFGCGKKGSVLCTDCKYNITSQPFLGCVICKGLSSAGICTKHGLAYDRTYVVGERSDVLQHLIGGFKFQNMKAAAVTLAELLHERIPPLPADTVIVPIPTASGHVRERGYDHMLLVAQYFSVKRQLPLARLLGRGHNETQHYANRRDRIELARTAFQINDEVSSNATYLILDDVVTTGSTIDQASRLLADAGAKSIWVGALARQPLD